MPDFIDILHTDLKELQYSDKLKKVRVAVLDTGVDATHPFVKGCVKESWRFEKTPENTFVPVKLKRGSNNAIGGHGTEIASRILLCAPNVEIIDIRVLDLDYAGGGGLSELVLEGFKLAISLGVKVINMSYTARKSIERKIAPLCEDAYRNHLIVVAAKRNNPLEDDLGFPAELSSVVAVDKASYGDFFDIHYTGEPPIEFSANGENVEVAQFNPSGYRNGYFSHRATGTSYATATVSAVIALFLGKYPDLKFFEIKTILKYLSDTNKKTKKHISGKTK